MFEYLLIDFQINFQDKTDLKDRITEIQKEFKQKSDFIKNNESLQAVLDAQISAYRNLTIKHDKLKEKGKSF